MRHVLLVEDEAGVQKMIELALNGRAQMVIAGTLDEARNLLPGKYDAVLLDMGLPDSSGVATYEAIRKAAPQIPIIVLTGGENFEVRRRLAEDGGYYIGKPPSTDVLEAIEIGIESFQTRQDIRAVRRGG